MQSKMSPSAAAATLARGIETKCPQDQQEDTAAAYLPNGSGRVTRQSQADRDCNDRGQRNREGMENGALLLVHRIEVDPYRVR